MFCAARHTKVAENGSRPAAASNRGTMNAMVARMARPRSGCSDSWSASRPSCGHRKSMVIQVGPDASKRALAGWEGRSLLAGDFRTVRVAHRLQAGSYKAEK